MNSRQRVRIILEHKIPDRVPIDLGSSNCTTISTIAYNRLRNKLNINSGLAKMYDFNMQLAYPEKEVLDLLHVDIIDGGQNFLKSPNNWREWKLNDGSKCLIPKYLNVDIDKNETVLLKDKDGSILGIKPKSSLYVDQSYWVWKNLPNIPDSISEKDLQKHNWAVPIPPYHLDIFDEKQFQLFVQNIKKLYEETEYSISLTLWCGIIEVGYFLRGFDNFLCDVYLEPKRVFKLLEILTESYMKLIEKTIDGVGNYVDILGFGDDFSGEDRMFFPPEVIKKMFIPYYKKMWNYIHEKSSCKVFFHSCGALRYAIPLLIDAGMDILNPVQTSAAGMDPEILKKEFGKYLIFWGGGVDTRKVLPSKTPEEVKNDVKKRIEIFSKNGGFVFNPIHNILADVPPENIVACYEAAYNYGLY